MMQNAIKTTVIAACFASVHSAKAADISITDQAGVKPNTDVLAQSVGTVSEAGNAVRLSNTGPTQVRQRGQQWAINPFLGGSYTVEKISIYIKDDRGVTLSSSTELGMTVTLGEVDTTDNEGYSSTLVTDTFTLPSTITATADGGRWYTLDVTDITLDASTSYAFNIGFTNADSHHDISLGRPDALEGFADGSAWFQGPSATEPKIEPGDISFVLHGHENIPDPPVVSDGPNIIFWMADDWGWTDLSTNLTNLNNGSDFYETPNIDRLANQGIAFSSAYACINCAPTRAALYSGQHAQRPTNNIYMVNHLERYSGAAPLLMGINQGYDNNDAITNDDDELSSATITLAETMKSAGYVTGHFGKYHVGASLADNGPEQQGYDLNRGGGTSGGFGAAHASWNGSQWKFHSSIKNMDSYAQPYTQAESDALTVPGQAAILGKPKNITDALADSAIDFMNSANAQGRPFFMGYCEYMVHSPTNSAQARPDALAKFQTKRNGGGFPSASSGHDSPSYAALLYQMDQSLGRLINYIETTPDPRNPGKMLDENTIVVVYSDNGGLQSHGGHTDNRPLRGTKGSMYEGGTRVPLIVWSANEALVNGEGRVDATPVQTIDFYSTFAALAGADTSALTLDGEDLSGIWADDTVKLAREQIYWHLPGYLDSRNPFPQSSVQRKNWKLLYNYEQHKFRLYHLATDLSETSDLVNDKDETVARLGVDLILWLKSLNTPLATVRPGKGLQSIELAAKSISYANDTISYHQTATTLNIAEGAEMPIVLELGELVPSFSDMNGDNTLDLQDLLLIQSGGPDSDNDQWPDFYELNYFGTDPQQISSVPNYAYFYDIDSNEFAISFPVRWGQGFRVERSTDLLHWKDVNNIPITPTTSYDTIDSTGMLNFRFSPSVKEFYRGVYQGNR